MSKEIISLAVLAALNISGDEDIFIDKLKPTLQRWYQYYPNKDYSQDYLDWLNDKKTSIDDDTYLYMAMPFAYAVVDENLLDSYLAALGDYLRLDNQQRQTIHRMCHFILELRWGNKDEMLDYFKTHSDDYAHFSFTFIPVIYPEMDSVSYALQAIFEDSYEDALKKFKHYGLELFIYRVMKHAIGDVDVFSKDIEKLDKLQLNTLKKFRNKYPSYNHMEAKDLEKLPLMGNIVGDILGSNYELEPNVILPEDNIYDFDDGSKISDDTILTLAVAKAFIDMKGDYSHIHDQVVKQLLWFGKTYPKGEYGGRFQKWLDSEDHKPYFSYGNGSAMRVGAVAYVAKNENECLRLARQVSEVTHNHLEGIKGAKAIALLTYYLLRRKDMSHEDMRQVLDEKFYKIDPDFNYTRAHYLQNAICQGTVPEVLSCFFNNLGEDFNRYMYYILTLGGDSDTLASILGGIVQVYEYVPAYTSWLVYTHYLDKRLQKVLKEFGTMYGPKRHSIPLLKEDK